MMCLCVDVCTRECSDHRDQKRAEGPPELELQAAVSHRMWVLGPEPRTSVITACVTLTIELSLRTAFYRKKV